MSQKAILVEIAAHSVQAAVAAQAGGAQRVELFSSPLEGGLTPSEGLMAVVRDRLKISLHIIIRPRGGDFCYCDAELEAMHRDVATARRIGVDGIALGILDPEGRIDVEPTRQLVSAARPLSVTFHRAIDMCRDVHSALRDAIACKVDRVLTSGGAADASQGMAILKSLVAEAGKNVSLIAAGGIRPANAATIIKETGVREVHAGLRSRVSGPMLFQNDKVSFGNRHSEFERIVIREQDVRSLVEQVHGL